MSRQRSVVLGVASAAVFVSPVSGIAGAAGVDTPQIADQLIAPGAVSVPVVQVPSIDVPMTPELPAAAPVASIASAVDGAVAPAAAPAVKLCDKDK